jgi:MiaB-like tRNA modifying enzyme
MEPILGTNTFYIETYGCTSNKADSYIISNILKSSNFIQTTLEEAKYIIINTCAVKEQTENKIKARLKQLYLLNKENPEKYLIIAGCLPHIAPNYTEVIKNIVPNFSAIIDLDNIHELPDILKILKKGKRNLILKSNQSIDKARFLIKHPIGKTTGIIPISEGCNGSCTYCCVKNARGPLNCYDPLNIVENVKDQLKQGIKQIYLTSQDCGIYRYNEYNLFDLVKSITSLNYPFYLRIGMINPSFLINNTDQLISIYDLKKVYKFLHIPIQSGSNNILKKMERPYLISDIVDKIEIIREKVPDLTISTDIICGFPSETEFDFLKTLNLIKWLKPEILNISKFTVRPGTKAKEMKQWDSRTIKERSIRLSKIFRNSLINMNKKWEGWQGEVLVLHGTSGKDQAFGRNLAYKNVFINEFNEKLGEFVKVKINRVESVNLYGNLV